MKQPFFTGACTALVTPFLNGNINYPLLERLLARQLEAGISTIVLAGTTGEAFTLSPQERRELVRRAKAFVGGEGRIIAGSGSNSTAQAVELSRQAQEAGADALLVVSPYYNKATEEGLFAHYLTVAHSVSLPILLYNVPSRTGVDIPVAVYQRLSRIPNILGIKEAATDLGKVTRTLNACAGGLTLWSGSDELITPMMALGAQGVISVLSNLYPREVQGLCHAALDGDFDTAAALQLRFQPLIDALFSEVNPIPVKAAMEILGFDCGSCRLPLTSMGDDNYARLKACLT